MVKTEYEEFIQSDESISEEEKYKWLMTCNGNASMDDLNQHIELIYAENPTLTPLPDSFKTIQEGYILSKKLNHWDFIPIYLDKNCLYANYFKNTYTHLVHQKVKMMGFMILNPGMTVPWHNHSNNPSKITHYNMYELTYPALFYFSDTMPYYNPTATIIMEYLQYEGDTVSFNTLKYHKTDNKNNRPRISFVIEEELE
jgi:hypothetical protein